MSLKPDYAEAHVNLGNILWRQGNLDAAVSQYRTVLALQPEHAAVHLSLGDILSQQGRLTEAVEHYQRALTRTPDSAPARDKLSSALNQLGIELAKERKFDEAVAHYQRALAVKPDYAAACNNLGAALADQGKFAEATQQLNHALTLKSDYFEAHHNIAQAFDRLRKLDEAVAHYRRAVELRPDFVAARIDLGVTLVKQGKLAEAISKAEIAGQSSDRPSFPYYNYGVLCARCGLAEEARRSFNAYVEEDPEDHRGARMALAGLGFEPPPERASRSQIDDIYMRRATTWDRGASSELSYRGAKLVANSLARLTEHGEKLDILDAGCGTGLVGALLRDRARRLDGVDLSLPMLERATEKGIYDQLEHSDLVVFLASHPEHYDVVAGAATLIHFGDLLSVFEAAAGGLRDGGLFIFTLFPNEGDADTFAVGPFDGLAEGGCFVHGRNYVTGVAKATGFVVEQLDLEVHEYSGDRPRMGLVVALRRRRRERPLGRPAP